VSIDDLIEKFVTGLFTNGNGDTADRLVLTSDGPPKRDLGGWGRKSVEDRVRALAAEVMEKVMVCGRCGGSGKWADGHITCLTCCGRGVVLP